MTHMEFSSQMQRLVNNYGKASYSDERSKLIWREVQFMDGKKFEQVVDGFISDFKFAPLGTDFREAISKIRERDYATEKQNHKKEALEFMSVFSGDDLKTICQAIKSKCAGEMSDDHFDSFLKNLKNLTNVDLKI